MSSRKRKFSDEKNNEDFPVEKYPISEKCTIPELINLIEAFEKWKLYNRIGKKRRINKNIDVTYQELNKLLNIKQPLKDLNDMVGMEDLKKKITEQIIFIVQKLHGNEMLHTVLTGPPGTGKTTVGKILCKIYAGLGTIKDPDNFIIADRSMLIGQYLGETAIKTKIVLEMARNGVLFIDEAYSLGNEENRDSFSKECIDTINQHLSENASDTICIIAGYKECIDKCFFKVNPGLSRRFPWRYNIDAYKNMELMEIFKRQVKWNNWFLDKKIKDADLLEIFKDTQFFKFSGGDTLNLFAECKIIYAKRHFFAKRPKKKTLSLEDIKQSLEHVKNTKKL